MNAAPPHTPDPARPAGAGDPPPDPGGGATPRERSGAPQAVDAPRPRLGWRDVPEHGSTFGMWALVRLATLFGRGPARLVVRLVALHYALFARSAREAANGYLARLGERTGFWPAYRQILRFAEVSLDALFFLQGKLAPFQITRDGYQHLAALRDDRRGAILLGAHLGSFYAMRAQSRNESLRLYPLVYTQNAKRINAVLRRLDPRSRTELVQMGEGGDMDFMLRLRELVEEGGLLAILGDRVPKGGRFVEVDFLGGRARLPVGPYLLAATLRCPVYFVAGVYRAPSLYELHCEPFAEQIVLPRARRMDAVAEYAQRYADTVARYCRDAPDNWFNFFDFWTEPRP